MIRSGHIGHPVLMPVFDSVGRLLSIRANEAARRFSFRWEPASAGSVCGGTGSRRSDEEEIPLASTRTPEAEPLLTPAEVATMFRVDPKTVTRWAKAGKLTSIRTLGGHRRYRETEVRALLGGIPQQRESD
jgi:excisionase family DNA binding protein